MYKNIIIAMDGSENAKTALDRAVELAKMNKAKLYIVNVIATRTWAIIGNERS